MGRKPSYAINKTKTTYFNNIYNLSDKIPSDLSLTFNPYIKFYNSKLSKISPIWNLTLLATIFTKKCIPNSIIY
jgi:hypothetical protein